jgi:hypothetical protein
MIDSPVSPSYGPPASAMGDKLPTVKLPDEEPDDPEVPDEPEDPELIVHVV